MAKALIPCLQEVVSCMVFFYAAIAYELNADALTVLKRITLHFANIPVLQHMNANQSIVMS